MCENAMAMANSRVHTTLPVQTPRRHTREPDVVYPALHVTGHMEPLPNPAHPFAKAAPLGIAGAGDA